MKWKVVPQEVVLHININAKVESKDECSGIPCKILRIRTYVEYDKFLDPCFVSLKLNLHPEHITVINHLDLI